MDGSDIEKQPCLSDFGCQGHSFASETRYLTYCPLSEVILGVNFTLCESVLVCLYIYLQIKWFFNGVVLLGKSYGEFFMAKKIPCPVCQTMTKPGGFTPIALFFAICFFPLGLIALLLARRKPRVCPACGYQWNNGL